MDSQADAETESPVVDELVVDEPNFSVPTQDTFDFRASLPYPQQDAQNQLNFGSLRLSDNRPHDGAVPHTTTPASRASRSARHHGGSGGRRGARIPGHNAGPLGRGAGTKRNLNYEELFGLANLKEGFGAPGSKRRHL